jgi:hypothetical protein
VAPDDFFLERHAALLLWGKEIRIQAGSGVLVVAGKPVQTAGRADVLAVPARVASFVCSPVAPVSGSSRSRGFVNSVRPDLQAIRPPLLRPAGHAGALTRRRCRRSSTLGRAPGAAESAMAEDPIEIHLLNGVSDQRDRAVLVGSWSPGERETPRHVSTSSRANPGPYSRQSSRSSRLASRRGRQNCFLLEISGYSCPERSATLSQDLASCSSCVGFVS